MIGAVAAPTSRAAVDDLAPARPAPADVARRPRSHGPRVRPFRWFTPALGILLLGYLFFSRSFAYLHVPGTPVFVGELVLALGFLEAIRVRPPWLAIIRSSPILRALAAFMALCALRLAVDLPVHGLDAIRDSAIWYYGAYAFLVTVAATVDATFVPRLLRWYRHAIPWFLAWAPIAVVLAGVDAVGTITVPDSATPINAFKLGDLAVQVGIALAFLWLGVHRLAGEPDRPRAELALGVLALIALLVVGTQNRGGVAATMVLLAIVLVHLARARRRLLLPVVASLLVVLTIVALLGLQVPGQRRDVSVGQVMANLASVTGSTDADLAGTVEWRQQLWTQVVDDVMGSSAWATGLGFGPILPLRYDVPLEDPSDPAPLRSVHNSHLTIIARVGLVTFAVWVLFWGVWARQLLRVRRRQARRRAPQAAMATWLLGASAAFLVNAYFDPSLEGPQAAVWLFVLVGLGAALTSRRPARRVRAHGGSAPW